MTQILQSDDQRPQWANELIDKIDRFNRRLDTYQKASDCVTAASEREANLAFTVVTASAAIVVLSPAVKAIADYFSR